jgi:uncharacterized protein GlcG (DUF336 family)
MTGKMAILNFHGRLTLPGAAIGAGLLLTAPVAVFAASPAAMSAGDVTLGEATVLAQAALAACRADGHPASVSIVGADGIVRLTLRDDGAVKQPVAAPIKAFTALSFAQSGEDMLAREKSDPAFAAQIAKRPDIYNDHPGSIPLYRGQALVGAIAVADVDHEIADGCARAAVAKAPLR